MNESKLTYLSVIARRINEREDGIEAIGKQINGKGSELVCEALLQGKDFAFVKSQLPHGHWLPWLKDNYCKSADRAQAYMRLANSTHTKQLEGSVSIRQALALLEEGTPSDGAQLKPNPKSWPAYINGLGRFSKFVGFIERHPLEQWPSEGLDQLKEDLLPIASRLWPAAFGEGATPHKESFRGPEGKAGYQTPAASALVAFEKPTSASKIS
jgi:hypothetical protein